MDMMCVWMDCMDGRNQTDGWNVGLDGMDWRDGMGRMAEWIGWTDGHETDAMSSRYGGAPPAGME